MSPTHTDGLSHDVFLYASERDFGETLEPFVREGLAAEEAVVAATSSEHIDRLREHLGGAAERVTFLDAADWYRHPPATIAGYQRALEDGLAAGAPRVRVIGEVPLGPSEHQNRDWVRYEAALNHVFASSPAWIVCPYDLRALPAAVLRQAARTHPQLLYDGRRRPSRVYQEPERLLEELPPDAPPTTPPATELEINGDLAAAREAVRNLGHRDQVDADTVDEFTVAVNEALTNALVHGRSPVRLRLYSEPAALACEVSDAGGGLRDPLAGYTPPATEGQPEGGMGLWLARSLCDHVELVPREGTTVLRLRKRVR